MPRKPAAPRIVTLPFWARWEQRPSDHGQMVEVYYATDGEYLYCMSYDRSDRSTTYLRAKIRARVDLERDMDVPNGALPATHRRWVPLAEVRVGAD